MSRPTRTRLPAALGGALAACLALGAALPAAAQAVQPGQANGSYAAPEATVPLQGRDQACAQLWRDYQKSQACFNRFRVVGGGLKQEAYAACGQPLPDPSAQCGPQRF